MGFQERRTDNFNNNINLPPIEPVGLILDFQSMSKWLVLSVGGQKVSTRTQAESSKHPIVEGLILLIEEILEEKFNTFPKQSLV